MTIEIYALNSKFSCIQNIIWWPSVANKHFTNNILRIFNKSKYDVIYKNNFKL
jgi:hypothetical protein